MTDSLPEPPQIDPAALAGTTFSRGRKGFDPVEVNSAMGRAADALRTWELRDRQLMARVEALESKLSESKELDEGRIASVLGEETARIITTARAAAGEIRSKAEADAASLLKETEESATARAQSLEAEATRLRDEAQSLRDSAAEEANLLLTEARESAASTIDGAETRRDELVSTAQARHDELLADGQSTHQELVESGQTRHDELIAAAAGVLEERTNEAEAVAAAMVAEGAQALAAAEEEARAAREAADRDAEAALEAARAEGRAMVAEAKSVRERILQDLADRRRIARQQIEGARAGRDTIVELLRSAGAELTITVDGLVASDGDAQRSAELAASSLEDDTDSFLDGLDVELGVDRFEMIDLEVTETELVTAEAAETSHESTASADTDVAESDSVAPDPAESEVLRGELVPGGDLEAIEFVELAEDEGTSGGSDALEDVATGDEGVDEQEESADDVASGGPATVADISNVIGIFSGSGASASQSDAEGSAATESTEDATADNATAEQTSTEQSSTEGAEVLADRVGAGAADLEEGEDDDALEDDALDDDALDDDALNDDALDDDALDGASDEIDITVEPSEPVTVDASGATVHDLFARIRAEGLNDPAVGDDAEHSTASVATVAVDDIGAVLDQRDILLSPIEKQLLRSLRRLASDEQNETLDKLRRVKRGRPEMDSVLAGLEESTSRFAAVLIDDFSAAVEAGIGFWVQLTGTSSDSLFDDAERTHDRLESMVAEFIAVHRAHLDKAFSEAEEAGLDTAELGDSLSAAYRDWRSNSLSELAGDLATAGFAHGERTAAGPGTPWRWVVDNGGLPCADGEDNALAGAIACEEPFPTGDITPPAHAGCRCMLVPAHH
ncbi:MAG: hypothetical protein WBA45_05125 [Microthrixaceae bacterium]